MKQPEPLAFIVFEGDDCFGDYQAFGVMVPYKPHMGKLPKKKQRLYAYSARSGWASAGEMAKEMTSWKYAESCPKWASLMGAPEGAHFKKETL